LASALALGDRPKIIRVAARIDLGAGAAAWADPGYDFEAYCRAYDPAVWGRRVPAGPQEEARVRSARRQADAVTLKLPPRTTLIGVSADAGFANGMVFIDSASQVILRRLRFDEVQDAFPAWDPLDGAHGEWNSDLDNLSLRRARHVWIDHCSFDGGDGMQPLRFGRTVERHDGLLDITRGTDLVSVSWCHFSRHDKTMLIGGSDRHLEDEGKLRVTLHHNLWQALRERTPRVRFGQVHVFNNLFLADDPAAYGYSIGVGLRSRTVSQNNVWRTHEGIASARLVRWLGGQTLHDNGSLHNGRAIDLLQLLQAAQPGRELTAAVGWQPPSSVIVDPSASVEARVRAGAGARGSVTM
ncbi:MAG: hypothetical protein Q8N44_13250, partial [Rubrivivax sp.]|nr:hypothetical protein [Rubrivivax sp.]